MSVHYSSSLERDIAAFEEEEARAERSRPVCSCCGEPIWEDKVVVLEERLICDECLPDELDKYREYVTDIIRRVG